MSIYTVLFGSSFYLFYSIDVSAKELPIQQEKRIKISLNNYEKPNKIEEKREKTKEKKKKEPITEKIEKVKPLQRKKVIVEPREVQKEVKPKQISKAKTDPKPKIIDNKKIDAKQNAFMVKLRELIDSNKHYPKSARRRGMEGSVEMRFNILKNGCVKHIEMVSGKSIFEKSAIAAIEKSFPIAVDTEFFSFPKEFRVTLVYKLRS